LTLISKVISESDEAVYNASGLLGADGFMNSRKFK